MVREKKKRVLTKKIHPRFQKYYRLQHRKRLSVCVIILIITDFTYGTEEVCDLRKIQIEFRPRLLSSYRHYPVNLDVISWLGVWYVKSELYEKAIHYFETAAQIQPTEVRWCCT